MAKSLARQEDIQGTSASMESGGQSLFLSIPDTKTPWYLLGLEYTSFFSHWYEGPQGRRAAVCAGGVEGGGFATDECPICEHVLELYQEGKRLREEEGDQVAGNKLKNRANDIRGKGSVVVKAIRGQYVLVKDAKGRKYTEADFELDPDNEDSKVATGLLNMSEAQWEGLTGLINGEHTPFITSGADLGNRVLFTKKERRKGKTTKYTAVVWGAEEEETEMPDVEIPKELAEIDLDELGKIDKEAVIKVAAYLTGQDSEDIAEDEEVELEGDSEDEPDDSYLDDIEDDDDIDEDDDSEDAEEDAEDLLDATEDEPEEDADTFEDDNPWEDEEEPKKKSKSAASSGKISAKSNPKKSDGSMKKSSSSSKAVSKSSGGTKSSSKTTSKKSGKTRL